MANAGAFPVDAGYYVIAGKTGEASWALVPEYDELERTDVAGPVSYIGVRYDAPAQYPYAAPPIWQATTQAQAEDPLGYVAAAGDPLQLTRGAAAIATLDDVQKAILQKELEVTGSAAKAALKGAADAERESAGPDLKTIALYLLLAYLALRALERST